MADAHSKSIDDYRIICERLQRTAFHKYVPGHTLIWGLLWPTQTQKYSPRSGHQGWSLRGWWCMTLFLCGLSIPRDQHYVRPTNIYITFFFLDIFFSTRREAEGNDERANWPSHTAVTERGVIRWGKFCFDSLTCFVFFLWNISEITSCCWLFFFIQFFFFGLCSALSFLELTWWAASQGEWQKKES